MRRKQPILGGLLVVFLATTASFADDFRFHHEGVMGTSLELHVRASDLSAAQGAERRVLDEIKRLSAIFSNHDPASEFRHWQRGGQGPSKLSPELIATLQACDHWRERTDGAFDPRVQALSQLWSRSAREDRAPSAEELDDARTLMALPAWRIDPDSGTAERLSDCPLSLDAIAKGAIVESACRVAIEGHDQIQGVLLNVGGDLRVVGELTGDLEIVSPWNDSETSAPLTRVVIRDRALATSGGSQRGFAIKGQWFSHILDPRTGRPADRVVAASVIAEDSSTADALATALNILAPEEGIRLVESVPGAAGLIVANGGRLFRSAGWARFERPLARGKVPAVPAQADGGWSEDHELLIEFTISQPETGGQPYRRPFVVVWVADEEGFPVRNLLIWVVRTGSGPDEWLPDLKRWYRGDQARRKAQKTDIVHATARPTRPPGSYSVVWDGQNDLGQPVEPGSYTIWIEAAREHGTYQAIRHKIEVPTEPFIEELKGNVEIESASITYRRKRAEGD